VGDDDSGCAGILVAGVLKAAIGDQHDLTDLRLIAIGLGAPVAADGAVFVNVGVVAAVGAWPVHVPSRPRYGDTAHFRQRGAAALAEPVGARSVSSALRARGILIGHTRVLGRIVFAFSTNAIRSHMSVASCAS